MPALLLCLATALLSACSHRVTRADAFYEKGMNYKEGKGVERSSLKSEKYLQRSVALYKKAALRGNAEAQYELAKCYKYGFGINHSYVDAVKWFHKAAEQGHIYAQNELGICYVNGQGVEQSMTEAAKWWKLAAEQGHQKAKEFLAKISEKKNTPVPDTEQIGRRNSEVYNL